MANGNFGGGIGTSGSPYLVEDYQDFLSIANNLNAHYRQVSDIDFSEAGTLNTNAVVGAFGGSYDGGNYKILNYKSTGGGLFQYTKRYTTVRFKNIHLVNANISNTSYCGGIVDGGTYETGMRINFFNCHVKNSTIRGSDGAGGIIGYLYASQPMIFECCSFDGTIIATGSVGGICGGGYQDGTGTHEYYDCFSSGYLETTNTSGYTGGITGSRSPTSKFKNCYTSADIFGYNVGGICGWTWSGRTFENCFVLSNRLGGNNADAKVGTITPTNTPSNTIINCYARNDIQLIG